MTGHRRSIRSMLLLPLSLAALVGCDTQRPAAVASAPQFYVSPDSVMRTLPFSEGVQVGSLLFLSGQLGALPGTMSLVPGGIEPEARQTMENIKAVLARHGATMKDVVKCTVFLADIKEWGAFNKVYGEYFSAPYPARSAFGTTGLALGARTEVECIAVVPGS